MSIFLLVGNGLSIDFCANVVVPAQRLDTTKPLGWKFPIRAATNLDVFDVLAELREATAFVRRTHPRLSDFEIIRVLCRISAATPEYEPIVGLIARTDGRWVGHLRRPHLFFKPLDVVGSILRYQLRLFLCAAFAHFHDTYAPLDPKDWPWARWFARHHSRLSLVCSLNYDLVAEWTLASVASRQPAYLIGRQHVPGMPIPVVPAQS